MYPWPPGFSACASTPRTLARGGLVRRWPGAWRTMRWWHMDPGTLAPSVAHGARGLVPMVRVASAKEIPESPETGRVRSRAKGPRQRWHHEPNFYFFQNDPLNPRTPWVP